MKKFLMIFIATMLIAMLASCSNNTTAPEAEGAVTTITLGIVETIPSSGVDYTMWHVSKFNEEEESYNIEVVNYTGDDVMRLWAELIAGNGPDVIYSAYYDEGFFGPLKNRDMLADLWPFIDADPEINRSDFFQNILSASQNPDGSLRTIANQFTVPTLISTSEAVGHVQSFTLNSFLEIISNALDTGIAYPIDRTLSGRGFIIHMLMYTDIGIIDFDGGVSHFESQMFYDLLDLALLLPREEALDYDDTFAGLRNGEHIFTFDLIFNADSFTEYEIFLGDFILLGFPSDEGSRYDAFLSTNLGINENSENPDAAWSFIRRYLLPNTQIVFTLGMPMRIDLFEQEVEKAMSELPDRFADEFGINTHLNALSEESAEVLRETVESISSISRFDITIANIVWEELPHFFSGTRTAEDVARIIQNRVTLYLNE